MRWKYAYYFLIVTFLVMIFVSLISISVSLYLNELRNKPVTIYSVDSASNLSADDTDENYNCSTSDSDQSIDNIPKEPVSTNLIDDNNKKKGVSKSHIDGNKKNILRADVHSVDSASKLIYKTDQLDNRSTSNTSQSTNNTKQNPVTARNDNVDDRNVKVLTEQSTLTPDKSILWLDIDNPDWILPIFFRNTSDTSLVWKYGCMGTLIHPKAVLTVRFCINRSKQLAHAVGIFDRKKGSNEVDVNYDQLYNPLKTIDARSYKIIEFSYIYNNQIRHETKHETALILMIIKETINSIKPVDVSRTSLMPLHDMFDEKIKKECIHVTFVKNSNIHHFNEVKIFETLMNRTAMLESYTKTFKNKCNSNICEFISLKHFPESNVFGTVDSLKLNSNDKKFELLGSPLACRLVGDELHHFSFAGILINSFYTEMYEYTNVNYELEWIQRKLKKFVT